MQRRLKWLSWLPRWLKPASHAPVSLPEPHPMPARVVLRFRDGSSEVLDPRSPEAVQLHILADRWLTGG
jgi:hypothetical protein